MKREIKQPAFRYVEVASPHFEGFRNRVVREEEVPAIREEFGDRDLYTTAVLFGDDLEEHVRRTGSIAGHEGKGEAHFLNMDLDHADGERVLRETRWFYLRMKEDLDVPGEAIKPYFSGSKGFHLMVDLRAGGGLEASEDVHKVLHELRKLLMEVCGVDPECMDLAIKDKFRLWRVPNTRNTKSGLHKIRLTERELLGLTWEEIRLLARELRILDDWDKGSGLIPGKGEIRVSKKFQRLLEAAISNARIKSPVSCPLASRKTSLPAMQVRGLCDAERKIWDQGAPEGLRNNSAIRLASRMRRAGIEQDQARNLVLAWNSERGVGLDEKELLRVVESAYRQGYGYDFGCFDPLLKANCPHSEDRDRCETYRKFKAVSKAG